MKRKIITAVLVGLLLLGIFFLVMGVIGTIMGKCDAIPMIFSGGLSIVANTFSLKAVKEVKW